MFGMHNIFFPILVIISFQLSNLIWHCSFFHAAVHCAAHFFNAFNFSRQYNSEFPDVNVAQYSGQVRDSLVLHTEGGICFMNIK